MKRRKFLKFIGLLSVLPFVNRFLPKSEGHTALFHTKHPSSSGWNNRASHAALSRESIERAMRELERLQNAPIRFQGRFSTSWKDWRCFYGSIDPKALGE